MMSGEGLAWRALFPDLKIVNPSKQGVCHVHNGAASDKRKNKRFRSDICVMFTAAIEA
jgi:hypothetical protein